jgi:catechol 2,3-dioxygenase
MAPTHEIAHLGHVQLFTPELARSTWFFTEILGLTEVGRESGSVFLRTWDDYEHYTLLLTERETAGIGRTALRTSGQRELDQLVARAEATGRG